MWRLAYRGAQVARARCACSDASRAPVMYCPQTHTWMQRLTTPLPRPVFRVGLTERALDDVGEVDEVQLVAAVGEAVAPHAALLRIRWQALHISDGDELYHTKWANVEGEHTLAAPCPARVVAVNEQLLATDRRPPGGLVLDEGDWLVELAVAEGDAPLLVDAATYAKTAGSAGDNTFGASEESLGYTSYG